MTTIDKAGVVLQALSKTPMGNQLNALEAATNIPKPTLYRILRSLIQYGMAKQDDAGLYRPGTKLFSLAATAYDRLHISKNAYEILLDLAWRIHQTVHLSVFRGNQLIYMDKLEADTPFQMRSEIGGRQALHCSAIGKCVLAHLEPDAARALLTAEPLVRYTPYSVVDVDEILAALPDVRNCGYALDDQEDEPSTRAIGAPLLRPDGSPLGGISIVVPSFEVSRSKLSALAPELLRTARAVEAELPT